MSAALWAMAKSLARPVARGDLPLGQAHAALIVATLREHRAGTLGPYKVADIYSGLRHVLQLHLDKEDIRRELASYRAARVIAPMIAQHKPWGELMSEAHGVNGAADFPLSEPEVNDLVHTEVFYSLPPAPRGRRNVR